MKALHHKITRPMSGILTGSESPSTSTTAQAPNGITSVR